MRSVVGSRGGSSDTEEEEEAALFANGVAIEGPFKLVLVLVQIYF